MSTFKLSLVGLGSRLVVMAMSVVNFAVLARYLDPSGRGEYFFFLTVVSVLTVLADGGLAQSVNVFSGRNEQWMPRIHSILIRLLLLQSLACLLVGTLVVWLVGDTVLPNFREASRWMAFSVLPMALYANLWNSMMIGLGQIWKMNLVQLLVSALYLLSTIFLVVNLSFDVVQAIIVYVAIIVFQGFIMSILAFDLRSRTVPAACPIGLARDMVCFALKGYAGSVSTLLWFRAPVFLLNVFHGPVAVGIFSVAQQLVEKLLVPLQSMQDAIYRKTAVRSHEAAILSTNRYLRLGLSCMLAVVLVGSILAPWIVLVLFGNTYAEAVSVFRVLLLGTAFMGLPMILAPYLLSHRGLPGTLSMLASINVFLCFLLGWLLTPAWGAIGAASAIVVTQVFGTVVVMTLYLRLAGTRFSDTFFPTREDVTIVFEQMSGIIWRKNLKV